MKAFFFLLLLKKIENIRFKTKFRIEPKHILLVLKIIGPKAFCRTRKVMIRSREDIMIRTRGLSWYEPGRLLRHEQGRLLRHEPGRLLWQGTLTKLAASLSYAVLLKLLLLILPAQRQGHSMVYARTTKPNMYVEMLTKKYTISNG